MSDFDVTDMAADPQPSGAIAGDKDLADRMSGAGSVEFDIQAAVDEVTSKLGIGETDSGHVLLSPEDTEPIGSRDMEVLDDFYRQQQAGGNDAG